MATYPSTIGGVGADYPTVNDWLDGLPADVGGDIYIGKAQADISDDDINLSVFTSDAGGKVVLRADNFYCGPYTRTITMTGAPGSKQLVFAEGSTGFTANLEVKGLTFKNSFLNIENTATTATERTLLAQGNYFILNSNDQGLQMSITNATAPATIIKLYNNIFVDIETGAQSENIINIDMPNYTTAEWDARIFIENNTVYSGNISTTGTVALIRFGTSKSGETYSYKNWTVVGEPIARTSLSMRNYGSATVNVDGIGRSHGVSGSIIETNDITGVTASEFLSVTYTDANFMRIDSDSSIYRQGVENSSDNALDIVDIPWVVSPALGAWSGESVSIESDTMLLGLTGSDITTQINSFVQLQPTYDYREASVINRHDYRSKNGKLFTYNFNSHKQFELPIRYETEAQVAKVQNWHQNNTDLDFYPKGSDASNSYNVRIIGQGSPFNKFEAPFFQTNRLGTIIIETR